MWNSAVWSFPKKSSICLASEKCVVKYIFFSSCTKSLEPYNWLKLIVKLVPPVPPPFFHVFFPSIFLVDLHSESSPTSLSLEPAVPCGSLQPCSRGKGCSGMLASAWTGFLGEGLFSNHTCFALGKDIVSKKMEPNHTHTHTNLYTVHRVTTQQWRC